MREAAQNRGVTISFLSKPICYKSGQERDNWVEPRFAKENPQYEEEKRAAFIVSEARAEMKAKSGFVGIVSSPLHSATFAGSTVALRRLHKGAT